MKLLSTAVARELGFTFKVLTLDEMSLAGFNFDHAIENKRLSQQCSIDTLYRCYKSNLIEFSFIPFEIYECEGGCDKLIEDLARVSMYTEDVAGKAEMRDLFDNWLLTQIVLTEVGENVYNEFFGNDDKRFYSNTDGGKELLYTDAEMIPFSEEICRIFEENGVPWSDEPLIPLKF